MRRKEKALDFEPNQVQILVLAMAAVWSCMTHLTSRSLFAQPQNGINKYLLPTGSETMKNTEILVAIAKCFPNRVRLFLPLQEEPFATHLPAMKYQDRRIFWHLFVCYFEGGVLGMERWLNG